MITWTPYTFVSIYNAFIKVDYSIHTVTNIAGLICKSSLLWSTLMYMLTNQNIRKRLNKRLFKRFDSTYTEPTARFTVSIPYSSPVIALFKAEVEETSF